MPVLGMSAAVTSALPTLVMACEESLLVKSTGNVPVVPVGMATPMRINTRPFSGRVRKALFGRTNSTLVSVTLML